MRTSEQIQIEIQESFGFVPPFFEPAFPNPHVLESLWQQTLSAYIHNPLPSLFKEKLSAYLSRFCTVPYCLVCHSCSLRDLGMKAREVLELLESPPPTEIDIDDHLKLLSAQTQVLTSLPDLNSDIEQSLLYCSIFIFLEPTQAEYCRSELRRLLGYLNYQHLVTFVAYVKMCHAWMEANPEVIYETDRRVIEHLDALLAGEPGLADFFRSYSDRVKHERQTWAERQAALAERKRNEAALRQSEEQLRLALIALQKAHDELEIKVEQRTAQLRNANQQLQGEIAERQRASLALRESEERYRSVVTAMHEGIVLQTADGKICACNASAERILGLTSEQMIGRTSLDPSWRPIHEDGSYFPGELHPSIVTLATGKPCLNVVMGVHKPNGELTWIVINSEPLFREQETKPYAVVTSFSDITDRKQAEETLRKLSRAVEQTADDVIITNSDGVIEYVNSAFEQLTGYTKEEAIGNTPRILKSGKHDQNFYEQLWVTILSGRAFRDVFMNMRKDGKLFYEEKTITPIRDTKGNITHFVSTGKDITKHKQAEQQIKASLKEKEVLLKEIHHRVKNNLQVISSLLNIQSRFIENQQALEIFKDSQNRIYSMALIHESLYQSRDLMRISFDEYIRQLATNLLYSYKIYSNNIYLKIDAGKVLFSINTAIPCGLIINELVANSLKYAFPQEREGEIYISLYSDSHNKYTLIVSDNGASLPKDLDLQSTKSLGLQLVSTLVNQLQGSIEIDTNSGTSFKIVFKELV